MKYWVIKYGLLFLIIFQFSEKKVYAGVSKDSLQQIIATSKIDSVLVLSNLKLSNIYIWDQIDSCHYYINEAIKIALRYKNPYYIGLSYLYQAMAYLDYDYLDTAIVISEKAIQYYSQAGDRKSVSNCYNIIGNASYQGGNLVKALENHLKALEIRLDIRDSMGIAGSYNNIGNVYDRQFHNTKALDYYFKAAEINIRINNKKWLAINYNNIGLIYGEEKSGNIQANQRKSVSYFRKALAIQEELGNRYGIGLPAGNLGNTYLSLNQYDSAIYFQELAIEISKEFSASIDLARAQINLANIYYKLGDYKKALPLAESGQKLAREFKSVYVLSYANLYLSNIYSKLNRFQDAYLAHVEYSLLRDSLVNDERTAETARMDAQFSYDQKQKADSIDRVQKEFEANLIREQEDEKRAIIRNWLIAGLLLLSVFGIYAYLNFRKKAKLSEELKLQKDIIEHKNKEITESITYAKRIQNSLLPDEQILNRYFSSSFIYYLPKDIVSGDFYWHNGFGNKIVFALADCTGHGVPGAIMSVMGANILGQIVEDERTDSPEMALHKLDQRICKLLRSGAEGKTTNDGMDIALAVFDRESMELHFSSARRPLVIIRNGEIIELKGSKFSIGGQEEKKQFELKTIKVQKGDRLYLFTDGYGDQFGGENGKKFKSKRILELLLSFSGITFQQQLNKIDSTFQNWKGDLEQVDDVCLIGLEV